MTVLIQGQLWLPSLEASIADLTDMGWCETLFTQKYILLTTCGISLEGAWLVMNLGDINADVMYNVLLPNY